MPELSVIICTHNPRADHLRETIEALSRQTLSRDRWELVLIDNLSEPPVSLSLVQSAHPAGRIVRESTLGLTAARLRGIGETSSPLLVFVDDDNVLAPDFLEKALEISAQWPILGAFGGQTICRFEQEPAPYLRRWCWVAERTFDRDMWSNQLHTHNPALPMGAGLCIRRPVANQYAHLVREDPLRQQFDRTGADLGGGGDTDMAMTACAMGLGGGIFHELKLYHLVPASRVQHEYVVKLVRSMTLVNCLLSYVYGEDIPADKPWSWFQSWRWLRHFDRRQRPFLIAEHEGRVAAAKIVSQVEENKKSNLPASSQTPKIWSGKKKLHSEDKK